jgi:5-methylcytosine-specific restriction endonuclease McrA
MTTRAHYLKNRDRLIAANRIWQSKNKDKHNAASRRYYERNKDKCKSATIRLAKSHRDTVLGYYARSYLRNAKKRINESKERVKAWRLNNPANRAEQQRRRRARKQGRFVSECSLKIKLLSVERFCRWCCGKLTDSNRTIGHIIPLARGGPHAPDNLCASCLKCNCSKGQKLVSEWLPIQEFAIGGA